MPARAMCASPTRRTVGPGAGGRELSEYCKDSRPGAPCRRRRRASRVRLSVGERGLRAGLRRRGPDLRRTAGLRDPGDGLEKRIQGRDGGRRRAGGTGLPRRGSGAAAPRRGGAAGRLSTDHQGERRRRRQRHAGGEHTRPRSAPRSIRRNAWRAPHSATTSCCWSATFRRRATWKYRYSPILTAAS